MREVRTRFKCHRNHIQHHDPRAPFTQQLNYLPTNPPSTACNQNNLLVPIILVCRPVIQHFLIEVSRHEADDAEVEQCAQTREGCWVQDGKVGAALRVPCQRDEEDCEEGVQRCALEEGADWVGGEACGCQLEVKSGQEGGRGGPSRGSQPLRIGILTSLYPEAVLKLLLEIQQREMIDKKPGGRGKSSVINQYSAQPCSAPSPRLSSRNWPPSFMLAAQSIISHVAWRGPRCLAG